MVLSVTVNSASGAVEIYVNIERDPGGYKCGGIEICKMDYVE
jgi:hypothetical protein